MSSAGPVHLASGKVRELYDAGDDRLLIVSTDRISAFDVVMDETIPDKGRALTQLSAWWFEQTAGIVPNHFISVDPSEFPTGTDPDMAGRAMLVRAAEPIRLECIVRGHLFGSAWAEYEERGTVNGLTMPDGLRQADPLPEPVFTPSTKAEVGHDEALTPAEAADLVGSGVYGTLERYSLALFAHGVAHAATCDLVLADTKFEFGVIRGDGPEEIVVIDEILTSDSSRYWERETYQPGTSPPSFDKQFVRDFLASQEWDRTPPPPPLPPEVVAGTRQRYVEAYERLTGLPFTTT
ncbi:MAG: phosphoribosylaminoimidazolesuccinocarboxamide synthase [Acidimicrobiia bacterium]|nr:phosphoribosylaminoimidazolesuccinocarboxamide synthase [Acidimicrobiia bacterium]